MARGLLIVACLIALPLAVGWILVGWLIIDEGQCNDAAANVPFILSFVGAGLAVGAFVVGVRRRATGKGWALLSLFWLLLVVALSVTFACG